MKNLSQKLRHVGICIGTPTKIRNPATMAYRHLKDKQLTEGDDQLTRPCKKKIDTYTSSFEIYRRLRGVGRDSPTCHLCPESLHLPHQTRLPSRHTTREAGIIILRTSTAPGMPAGEVILGRGRQFLIHQGHPSAACSVICCHRTARRGNGARATAINARVKRGSRESVLQLDATNSRSAATTDKHETVS